MESTNMNDGPERSEAPLAHFQVNPGGELVEGSLSLSEQGTRNNEDDFESWQGVELDTVKPWQGAVLVEFTVQDKMSGGVRYGVRKMLQEGIEEIFTQAREAGLPVEQNAFLWKTVPAPAPEGVDSEQSQEGSEDDGTAGR